MKKALIHGKRVAQIVNSNADTFAVTSELEWRDCPDNCKADQWIVDDSDNLIERPVTQEELDVIAAREAREAARQAIKTDPEFGGTITLAAIHNKIDAISSLAQMKAFLKKHVTVTYNIKNRS